MVNEKPINVAIFEFEDKGQIHTCTGSAFVNTDDAIHDAWRALQSKGINGNQVKKIYSEWRPSSETEKFIKENFAVATLTYSFEEGDEEQFKKRTNKLDKKRWREFWK